ncbi:unnamed protein product [Brassicogethes aeneus]|uniref:PARP catalytic domain-containing protein n=1 Tax=Brassicogethes aeneus TaxID=1431903 RepID=A0A9P0AQM9_BRAAE|nr:unnamed protein product [Brassicogethes aeneus]
MGNLCSNKEQESRRPELLRQRFSLRAHLTRLEEEKRLEQTQRDEVRLAQKERDEELARLAPESEETHLRILKEERRTRLEQTQRDEVRLAQKERDEELARLAHENEESRRADHLELLRQERISQQAHLRIFEVKRRTRLEQTQRDETRLAQKRRDEELATLTRQLYITTPGRSVKADEKILSKPRLILDLLINFTETNQWQQHDPNSSYCLVLLPNYDAEYHNLVNKFRRTNKNFYKVTQIAKMQNKYLYAKYKLKQIQTMCNNVETLYHGTKMHCLDAICKENLNWRLHQRSKFGRGVSFSSISYYSTHYCDKDKEKIMLVVDVLVNNWCHGEQGLMLPPNGYETTKADKNKVIVKYDDFTFYPKYVIYYEGIDYSKKNNYHRRNHFMYE